MRRTVGILGGGQLARMLALAAAPLGVTCVAFDPVAGACSAPYARLHVGDYHDHDALARFADGVDVVTFDFENVPASSAEWLSARVPVRPNPQALAVSQDRFHEKSLLVELGIPVPAFAPLASRDELRQAVEAIGLPCILKTRRFGYDGKGQFRLHARADVDAAWAALGAQADTSGLIVEALVPFEREVSVIAARSHTGEFRPWALTENWHVDGVLSASLAPAQVEAELAQCAFAHARALAERLDYIGVFALELFQCDGGLIANEMAPRVHNSGHWSIEGAETSQFEQHLRAILGLPLGDSAMRGQACMLNWVGTLPDPATLLACPGGHWHAYGKTERAGRKLGHATVRADSAAQLRARLSGLATALGRQAQFAPVLARLNR